MLDAMIVKGVMLNNNKSLLLFAERRKTNTAIKKHATTFLYEVCTICGLFDKVVTIETTKNKTTAT
ncbi:hypothetical protein GCM10011518_39640 [Flavobacterium limi]|uniref:Uncharacterized protein n=1 Tax=Flavobacterium limi TaxID=2045105 RepID=A0ABQ1UVR2_9FLAO|nr:hypothetical protein GCM10011518_39640 [Flavobacterium limi]